MDLNDIRVQIDSLDDEMVALIKKRLELAMEVAKVKKEENLPIVNTARERAIINRLTQGEEDEIAGYIKILYTTMFDLSRSHQVGYIYQDSVIGEKIKKAL
ncbi:MAG: chorismate mutase, partial [Lachnospiraceae bacterium]|nr:chorismate mutase [Lachnospiraceae bacterium]